MIPLLLLVACASDPWTWPASTWQDPGVATVPSGSGDTGGSDTGGSDTGGSDTGAPVRINELMADNDSSAEDEHGQEDDWIELVALQDVDLTGWTLRDDTATWTAPEGTVLAAGEHLLLWADDDVDQGPLHLPFRLSAGGETITLSSPDGRVADQWEFGAQETDVALGRFPDATGTPAPSIVVTPGQANPWTAGPESDPSQLLFPDDGLLFVDIFLPEESLAALDDDPYTYVEGAVGIGPVTLQQVGVRIKGQAGSKRGIDQKFAMKISMDAFGRDARFKGLENITLNNMVQDPSLVHETMAYTLFRDLGVPAPRTAHAVVTVNGELRGLYLHVETADDTFLARWYVNPEGNLYEGEYGEDVTLARYEQLEQDELGADDPDDYSDLAALALLLEEEPSEDRVAELAALVDIDEALTMVAVEVLVGHWDGYFWYPNNYRVYHHPADGLLSLLPWGVDQTFSYEGDPLQIDGALAAWMLEIPSLRAAYLRKLEEGAARMTALGLDTLAAERHALALPWFSQGTYEEHSVEKSQTYMSEAQEYVLLRPGTIAEFLDEQR